MNAYAHPGSESRHRLIKVILRITAELAGRIDDEDTFSKLAGLPRATNHEIVMYGKLVLSRVDDLGGVDERLREELARLVTPPGEPDRSTEMPHSKASDDSVGGFLNAVDDTSEPETREERAQRIHEESLALGMTVGPGWCFKDGQLIPPPPLYGRR